ncbi:hypothetical protein NDU88_007736 [Pleurodeles waltl]|uniref:Uncharacterized protein n=1 Tax=Pleurodeles waltl TaxID=8319 RepID=A0AAV7PUS7_PLEWA|nr:hypothetical protein NDU88_007736 [Pleurodeles waltl]
MLVKTPNVDQSSQSPTPALMEHTEVDGPVTQFFLEALFAALRDDLHTVKGELSQDLKDVQKEVEEMGDHVSMLEDNATGRYEELKHLQQEVIHLKEQQIEIQALAGDLEN